MVLVVHVHAHTVTGTDQSTQGWHEKLKNAPQPALNKSVALGRQVWWHTNNTKKWFTPPPTHKIRV